MAATTTDEHRRAPAAHAMSIDEVARLLETDPQRGLSASEAADRLARDGPNRIRREHGIRGWRIALRQFTSPLIVILLAAALVSVAIGHEADAATILSIVILNGILGFAQEWRAEKAVQALRRMLEPECRVRRGATLVAVPAESVVAGDLVVLESGDRVPADIRLVTASAASADESAITGESFAVLKDNAAVGGEAALADRSSMMWMGTTLIGGYAEGLVVATGMRTELGSIARMTASLSDTAGPLQRQLVLLGRQLGIASLLVAALVAAAGVLLGRPPLEMFMTGVALAVAVVPEGLPAVVTITLALGIRAMARERALLRQLHAAETLGAATVICTDKTGTLTENQMTAVRVWLGAGELGVTGSGYAPAGDFRDGETPVDPRRRADLMRLCESALYCNHAEISQSASGWALSGEPTEGALVVLAMKAGLAPPERRSRAAEFPFSSERRRMTVVEEAGGTRIAHTKGAPETLLSICERWRVGDDVLPLDETARRRIAEAGTRLADDGLRVLAVARRELPPDADDAGQVESDMVFLGMVAMLDPPRPEVPDALAHCRRAGVGVVVITGDAPATALAVCRKLGLEPPGAVTGTELERLPDVELERRLDEGWVFARTSPQHKIRIVGLLQARGEVVAMTGDGVNDAPALQKADIGIAMGIRGTDVARGAAEMVLADDNFASIVAAIREGRRQFDNICKFVRYLLSSNAGEVIAILANVLLGGPLILLPVQILWMNLVTDGLVALALGEEPAERDLMDRPPRSAGQRIMDRGSVALVIALGGYIGLATLWLFHHYLADRPEGLAYAQTMAFTGIIVFEKINVLNFRSLRQPLTRHGLVGNPWILTALALALALQLAAVYWPPLQRALHTVPLAAADWLVIAALGLPVLLAMETLKYLRCRRDDRGQSVDSRRPSST